MNIGRYALTSPAIAPPKMYVNISVKMIGCTRDVDELLGGAPHLEQRALGHDERIAHRLTKGTWRGKARAKPGVMVVTVMPQLS